MVHFILRQNLVIQCSLLEHMLKKINSFYTTFISILNYRKNNPLTKHYNFFSYKNIKYCIWHFKRSLEI